MLMLRKEIEQLMKQSKQEFISLIYNENDQLGMLCQMKAGILHDCWGHRVPLKQDIWGILVYEKGVPVRYPIKEKINEVLFCE